MAIVTKMVEVKVCDVCGAREDLAEDIVRKCCMCGKDFCSDCGEVYVGQIGSTEQGVLWLCKDCVEKIAKFKVCEDCEGEDDEDTIEN